MKNIVIVGAGSAGLITAAYFKNYWEDDVNITVYYDSKCKNISVGESTTPLIVNFITDIVGISVNDFLKRTNSTIKLGVNFKNWIPGTEYFHGFDEIEDDRYTATPYSIIYSLLNNLPYNGGVHNNNATNLILKSPESIGDEYAFHIDCQEFSEFLFNELKDEVNFIDDIIEDVNIDGKNIESIKCKNSGVVKADFFIDASGFNKVLFKHLDPEWEDISDTLPIDRAIPYQIPNNSEEIPSYTLAEATKNGWIWRIPIKNRYGTGYMYSSKFTSDEEAMEDYNSWLLENYNEEIKTDRIIKYNPGYYKEVWIGNCLAVGLTAGFIEPLEAFSIMHIMTLIEYFLYCNPTIKNLSYNRKYLNKINYEFCIEMTKWIALHYNTNRLDSKFWKYMTTNKMEWVSDLEEKCKKEYIDITGSLDICKLFSTESQIQIINGLNMFNKEGMSEYLFSLSNELREEVLENAALEYTSIEKYRKEFEYISHKEFLESIKVGDYDDDK